MTKYKYGGIWTLDEIAENNSKPVSDGLSPSIAMDLVEDIRKLETALEFYSLRNIDNVKASDNGQIARRALRRDDLRRVEETRWLIL